MDNLLLAAAQINDMWHALPLVIAVSLVYSATRDERMFPILVHALKFGGKVAGVLAVLLVLLLLMSR